MKFSYVRFISVAPPPPSPFAKSRQEHDLVDIPHQVVVVGHVHVVVIIVVVIVVIIIVIAVAVCVGDSVGSQGDRGEDEVEDGEGGGATAARADLFFFDVLLLALEDDVIASDADLAERRVIERLRCHCGTNLVGLTADCAAKISHLKDLTGRRDATVKCDSRRLISDVRVRKGDD